MLTAKDIIEVTPDRGPCFGPGPVFRFSASRHAGYRYAGRSLAEPIGERSGGMPGYLFDRLSEVCVELRVLDLDDDYPSDIDDVGSLCVTVRHAGGVKVIRSECGDAGPVRLWAFA